MHGDWPNMTIAECAADEPYATQIGPFGKALTPEAYQQSGVPVLRGVNVNRGRFHDDDFVFISEKDADRLAKFESFPGDVLLVHKGTLGQIGLMPIKRRFKRYIMGNSMMRVRCNRAKLLPEYLHYWLRSPAGQHYLMSRVSQVGVPQIQRPLSTLREAVLPVPSIPEQEAIAGVLGALDDKIEQNRRTAQTLERLAQAIFRAWFLDYEPVRAKELGASTFRHMPQDIFDRFPDRFTESEIGALPHGWTLTTNGEIFGLEYGKPLKADQRSFGSVPVFGSNGVIGWHNEALVHGPGIVVGRKGNPGAVQRSDRPFFPIDTALYVVRKRACPLSWLFYTLQQQNLGRLTADSAVPGLNRNVAYSVSVALPSGDILDAFDNLVLPLWNLEDTLQNESSSLASLRDILLPRLLSGRIRLASGCPECEGAR